MIVPIRRLWLWKCLSPFSLALIFNSLGGGVGVMGPFETPVSVVSTENYIYSACEILQVVIET